MKFFQSPAKFVIRSGIFLNTHFEYTFALSFLCFLQQHLRHDQLTICNLNNGFRAWLRNAPGLTQTTQFVYPGDFPVSGVRQEQSWLGGKKRRANITDSLRTKRFYELPFVITTVLAVSSRQGCHLSDLL